MNLPEYEGIRVRTSANSKREVLDILRGRFVALTPEEWVRQHFVNYLNVHLGYPLALMGNEVEIRVGEKRLRCDTVLFDSKGCPLMIMEYKAEEVPLTQEVLRQVCTYNMLLHARYLAICNGVELYCMKADKTTGRWLLLSSMPRYEELQTEDK